MKYLLLTFNMFMFRITSKIKLSRAENLTLNTREGHNHNDLELQTLTASNHISYHEDSCPLEIRRGTSINSQNSASSQNTLNGSTATNRLESSFFGRMKIFRGRQDSLSGSRYTSNRFWRKDNNVERYTIQLVPMFDLQYSYKSCIQINYVFFCHKVLQVLSNTPVPTRKGFKAVIPF